jgi:hypothetical protein
MHLFELCRDRYIEYIVLSYTVLNSKHIVGFVQNILA